jgi:hypothetical protein
VTGPVEAALAGVAIGLLIAIMVHGLFNFLLSTSGNGFFWVLGLLAAGVTAFILMMALLGASGYVVARGTGIWGINIPVGWGFAIINFVWWIGIGHAGTLISAILLLLHQDWRTSINRFAEAMTLLEGGHLKCKSVSLQGAVSTADVRRRWGLSAKM